MCGNRAIRLSRKFKAPRRGDIAQWAKVEALVKLGFRFDTVYDAAGGGPVQYRQCARDSRVRQKSGAARCGAGGRTKRSTESRTEITLASEDTALSLRCNTGVCLEGICPQRIRTRVAQIRRNP